MTSSALKFKRPEHSEIKHKNMRFLITDRPTDSNVERYIDVIHPYRGEKKVHVWQVRKLQNSQMLII